MSRLIKKADSAEDLINTPAQQDPTADGTTNQNIDTTTQEVDPANQSAEQPQAEEQPKGLDNEHMTIVIDILKRVGNSADDIKAAYYSLLDNLNALNKEYTGVYNEFKLMVKLPNQNDVRNIAQMRDDIQEAVNYLQDPDFLSGFVK